MNILLLFLMLFLHIVDDYYMQGIFVNVKQRLWWEEHYPEKLYTHDYIIGLLEHAFSWIFTVMLPYGIYVFIGKGNISIYLWMFISNMIIHAIIDHLKANVRCINLLTDQLIHISQVILIWFMCFGMGV